MGTVLSFSTARKPGAHPDLRLSPRIALDVNLTAMDVETRDVLRLIDLSLGGCLVAGTVRFTIGTTRVLDFDCGPGRPMIRLAVRVVHQRLRAVDGTAAPLQVVGVAFEDPDSRDVMVRIDRLIEYATGIISYL